VPLTDRDDRTSSAESAEEAGSIAGAEVGAPDDRSAVRGRWPLRLVSVAVLVVLLGGTVAATLVVREVVADEGRRLLGERANEVVSLLTTSFAATGSELATLGTASSGGPTAFAKAASPLVGKGTGTALLLSTDGAGFHVLSAVGETSLSGTVLAGPRSALASRALTASGFVSAVFADGATTRLGLAQRDATTGEVVYFDVPIDQSKPTPSAANSPFHELQGIVYASSRADPTAAVLNTEGRRSLSGPTVRRTFSVGADTWLAVIGAREPLVGSFAVTVPWIILGGGLFAALLATLLVETLARRRLFALGLVEQRTRALRRREATLGAVFATCPDVIHLLGPDGAATEVSPAVERVLGYPPAHFLGRPITELADPSDRAELSEVIGQLALGEADQLVVQYRSQRANGAVCVLESQAAVLRDHDGAPGGIVVVTRDITERAELERAQTDARLAAESANRSKSEFLSRMSHELRTPLNAVLGFAQLMEMGELSVEQAEATTHILRGGRHLLDLINEVLDISRIETGQLALSTEPVLLGDVLAATVDLVAPLAAEHDVTVAITTMGGAQHVLADRQRLKQVLLNLLSNAVKYNRSHGRVEVGVEPIRPGRVRVTVSDTGPGIAAEKLDRLFTPFDRLGAEQSSIEGTGIGLALSRRLVEAMAGELGVDTTPGVGSRFWFDLPAAEGPIDRYERENGPTRQPRQGAGPSDPKYTVVHIEDNLANLALIERILAQQSATRLVPATEGRQGIELVRRHQPDLVLLDMHLPDLNGDQVLHMLKDDPATAAIPVVMLSADATTGQVQRLIEAGAEGYLTKPLDVQQLFQLLNRVLVHD
jgi:PAS domain S-box-containing protein